MALSDTFIRQIKPTKPSGDKYYDGGGLYLFVKGGGRYWRLDYRYLNKRKTMSRGTDPEVSLTKARKDATTHACCWPTISIRPRPSADREARLVAASNTFELVARLWLEKERRRRSSNTQAKVLGWLEHEVFPYIGKRAVSELKPRDVLLMVQKVEARGAFDSAHRIKQMCGQVFRFAVALDFGR
jgi:hypothetical protein